MKTKIKNLLQWTAFAVIVIDIPVVIAIAYANSGL